MYLWEVVGSRDLREGCGKCGSSVDERGFQYVYVFTISPRPTVRGRVEMYGLHVYGGIYAPGVKLFA